MRTQKRIDRQAKRHDKFDSGIRNLANAPKNKVATMDLLNTSFSRLVLFRKITEIVSLNFSRM
jgi:hypothetical protein